MSAKQNRVNLIIDSGAFVVWSKGRTIDLKDYAAFLTKNHKLFSRAVNLDVLPGQPNKVPTKREVRIAAVESMKNWKRLLGYGIDTMPVFHCGEEDQFLKRMLDAGARYIGFGGLSKVSGTRRYDWLDRVFPMVGADIRVHGFAITAVDIMTRYPWASVDSMTYMRLGGMGSVMVPRFSMTGHPRWDCGPAQVVVTSGRTNVASHHIDTMGDARAQQWVEQWVGQVGLTIKALREDRKSRIMANAFFFSQFERNHRNNTSLSGGLFDQGASAATGKGIAVHLTVDTTKSCWQAVSGAGAQNRLLSYWEFRKSASVDLAAYVKQDQWVSLSANKTR